MGPFIDLTHLPRGVRVVVSGDLDVISVGDFRGALADATDIGGRVEIDLSDVTFADSQLLHALATAVGSAGPGRHFEIVGASAPVRRLLDLTGFEAVIPVRPASAST